MASLLILTGARKGQTLTLRNDRCVLGRDTGCDVVIDETLVDGDSGSHRDSVSRRHAVIARSGENYSIEDGNGRDKRSRNGIFVNGRKVPFPGSIPLRDNDHIRICDFACTFDDDAEHAVSVEAFLAHDSSHSSLRSFTGEKLQVILQITNELSHSFDLGALLPRILDHLFRLFPQADRGLILLRDEDEVRPTVHAFKSRRPEDAEACYSSTIVHRCLEKVEAILGKDLPREFPDSESVLTMPARTLLCAPLWNQDGQALGAIQLDSRGKEVTFQADDLKLLLGVAGQASIVVCNARLHREALAYQRREYDLELGSGGTTGAAARGAAGTLRLRLARLLRAGL